ncbi:hypothetical protein N781_17530 [Pontibacillus halophilus JSM 076056 = DSM 19796]|uniref:YdhG-like domain-containing protein n=1 Tax=Pontibacillus halophilus JSM 076056 = DSM 19796 TaxID=1385510 RepID=A0A0A5GFU3_9BACI|nr:DUF1801 domain-containing protein [Pontibacillus halophilus]KGX92111.1 hypothetical protein N781_17530 [Pontibacillus halophilus JSM 076056 = DSM 19796]
MQYDAGTPEDYLQQLEDDWRKEKLLFIRELILKEAPELQEGIQYKMLSFGDGTTTLFHLNAQKAYVSLYVGDINKINDSETLLEGLDVGKGCIRIKKSKNISETGLQPFIQKAIQAWKSGSDLSC